MVPKPTSLTMYNKIEFESVEFKPETQSFGYIVSFICAKEMLEPMRPLVTALQGRLVEVYFGFQKIEEVINCYAEIRSAID